MIRSHYSSTPTTSVGDLSKRQPNYLIESAEDQDDINEIRREIQYFENQTAEVNEELLRLVYFQLFYIAPLTYFL